jgi:hypothetical protein
MALLTSLEAKKKDIQNENSMRTKILCSSMGRKKVLDSKGM